MVNLITYGSLIDSYEKYNFEKAEKIKLYGYERHCNQESVTRNCDRNGVFNLEENKYAWINGILLRDLRDKDWRDIVFRERGYSLIDIEEAKILDYEGEKIEHKNVKVFIGTRQKEDISSSLDYIYKCLRGCKSQGEEFYKDFCRTSYIYEEGRPKRLDKRLKSGLLEKKLSY